MGVAMSSPYSATLLETYKPLGRLLSLPRWKGNATEFTLNGPEEGYIYVAGEGKKWLTKKDFDFIDSRYMHDLFHSLANAHGVKYSPQMPLLACKTPDGHRFMGITGPTVDEDHLACSIRLKRRIHVTWEDYLADWPKDEVNRVQDRIRQCFADGKTVLILGGTNAGKTTVLNLAAKDVPREDRVITLEDTRELEFENRDKRHFIYARYDGSLRVTAADLIDAVVRLNPDQFWISELSIRNAAAALQIMDTGHSFSATSHANTPLDGLRGWRRRVALSGGAETELGGMMDLFADNVALIIQVKQVHGDNGKSDSRRITDVISAKEALAKREVREELASEPVFPRLPAPEEMRNMIIYGINGGKPLTPNQEENLKMMGMMLAMLRPVQVNQDNHSPGYAGSLDPIEQMQVNEGLLQGEGTGPKFMEVAQ
jgi:type IV secretion system protein VirB11